MESIKQWGRDAGSIVFGREPRKHRIPFGPIRGKYVFTAFHLSPRMYFGLDEPWVTQLARDLVRPNSIVYDIGAHIGYTTVVFAHLLNHKGQVHAFEILPSTAELLMKTVKANNLENVKVHNVGVGSREMTLNLPIGRTAMTRIDAESEGGDAEVCTVVSLDAYVHQHRLSPPSLMKVDIEGAEIDFLVGANGLIDSHRPLMIIEFHSDKLLEKGLGLLRAKGYRFSYQSGDIVGSSARPNRFPANVLCTAEKYA